MSRIHDILAKAEREGTVGRTHFVPDTKPAALVTPSPTPRVDGTSALESPFMSTAVATPSEPRVVQSDPHPALVAALAPHSAAAEQFRAIRTRISHREETTAMGTILVTSPRAGEGKSVTATNLALTMAQELQRNTLLVDADLRTPSVHDLLGIVGAPGLSDVLAGEVTVDEALVYLPEYHLTVLPAGQKPQFPAELLGSTRMRRMLDLLRTRFDRIVLDATAVTPLADVGTLAPFADGVVLVVRAGSTQRPALDEALGTLERDKILGIILNDVV